MSIFLNVVTAGATVQTSRPAMSRRHGQNENKDGLINRDDNDKKLKLKPTKIIWNGIMDVVYLSEGKWHIVDYKTNADGNDLDNKYQAQLRAYIKAFKATTGEDADAMTYHIDI